MFSFKRECCDEFSLNEISDKLPVPDVIGEGVNERITGEGDVKNDATTGDGVVGDDEEDGDEGGDDDDDEGDEEE